MKPSLKILMLSCLVLTLTGCRIFRNTCEAPTTPEETATVPSLRVPEGFDAPDTRNALRIPDLNEPERVRAKEAPCLEQPPAFSPGWQPVQEEPAAKEEAGDPLQGKGRKDGERSKRRKQE